MRDLRKHRRVPLTNPALANTEVLRDTYMTGLIFGSAAANRGSGRQLTGWDDSTPTPIMGNPILPQVASVGSPE